MCPGAVAPLGWITGQPWDKTQGRIPGIKLRAGSP